MGGRECGQKKDSYKRELKEMRAMIKEAHRAGKAAKVRPTRQPSVAGGWLRVVVWLAGEC